MCKRTLQQVGSSSTAAVEWPWARPWTRFWMAPDWPQPAYGSCACRCHRVCGKCCEGWEAAPPAAAPPAAAPPTAAPPASAPPAVVVPAAAPPEWVRIDELRAQAAIQQAQWAPLDADGNVAPAQPRPVVQLVPLDADGNVPPAQPRQ
ncbi:hypothetical protein ACLKA6_017249 [Drosophila palustris]